MGNAKKELIRVLERLIAGECVGSISNETKRHLKNLRICSFLTNGDIIAVDKVGANVVLKELKAERRRIICKWVVAVISLLATIIGVVAELA